MKIKELNFPAKTAMSFFQDLLSEKQLLELIKHFARLSKKERTIELPSNHILKKVICHWYGRKVMNGEMTFDQVVKKFRKDSTFAELGLEPREIRRLFWQREKEILREKK